MLSKFVLPLCAAIGVSYAVMHVVKAQHTPPTPPPPVEPARSPFTTTVAGTGLVEPRTENIAIGSHSSGIVSEVLVKVGQRVPLGEPLFRLDDRALKAELATRRAMLQASLAKLDRLQNMPRSEELPPAEAKVREADANLNWERDQLQRARRLASGRAIAEEDLTRREQAYRMAEQQMLRVKADFDLVKAGAWLPDVTIARAEVEQAKALLQQTETELDRLCMRASLNGEVLQVNIRPGEFVAVAGGRPLIVLGDVHDLHLRVDIDEHDIFRFDPNQPAHAMVRGNMKHQVVLKFVRVEPYVIPKKSLTGDTSERVDTRVLQVIYAVEAKEDSPRLFVGQQMDVFVEAKKPAS